MTNYTWTLDINRSKCNFYCMIKYVTTPDAITPAQLTGFFVGWPSPPDNQTHLEILKAADHVVLAIDSETDQVVGFINAISDRIHAAYIPLLEVLPEYKRKGIGAELVKRILTEIGELYMIDLLCDADVQPFYEKLGLTQATGMRIRNLDNQSGEPEKN